MILKKKLIIFILAVISILCLGSNGILAGISYDFGNGDDTFYYTAIGDSVAAGADTTAAVNEGKDSSVFVLMLNYKNCPTDSYPYLLAQSFFNVLQQNGYIDSSAKFGYDTDNFGWSNLGCGGFKASDFTASATDSEYVSLLGRYFGALSRMEYDYAVETGTKDEYLADLKATAYKDCSEAWENYIYTVENTPGEEDKIVEYVTTLTSYGVQMDEGLATFDDYIAVHPGWFDTYFKTIYKPYYFEGKAFAAYDYITDEVVKADLATVQLGIGELLVGLIEDMLKEAFGSNWEDQITTGMYWLNEDDEDSEKVIVYDLDVEGEEATDSDGNTYVADHSDNAAMVMLVNAVISAFTGGYDSDEEDSESDSQDSAFISAIAQNIYDQNEYYTNNRSTGGITTTELEAILDFVDFDNLESLFDGHMDDVEGNISDAIDTIKELNDAIELVLVGYNYPYVESTSESIDWSEFTDDEELLTILSLLESGVKDFSEVDFDSLDTSEVMEVLADYVLNQLSINLNDNIDVLNDKIKSVADDNNILYIDITGTPREEDIDPHPDTAGHAYIADKLEDTLIENINLREVSAVGLPGIPTQGPEQVIYGCNADFDVLTGSDIEIEDILIDGVSTGKNGHITAFSVDNITEDTNITVKYKKSEAPVIEELPFTDVETSDYYYDAVRWALENNVTAGMTETLFGPDEICTRGQVVTFLWRAKGEPEPGIGNPFVDIDSSDYYYKAVLWAYENSITLGMDETHFNPDGACTRSQVVSFLWRLEGKKSTDTTTDFKDISSSDYYYTAVLWAVENDIAKGITATTFGPKDTCTRAHIVTFLYRAFSK